MTDAQDNAVSSQGHHGSAAGWLDAHFQTAEPEYLTVARAAGFQRGWHVLDAGCGVGSFLPVLADQIGSAGRLTATGWNCATSAPQMYLSPRTTSASCT
jgi:2-polyprenyl-3-methyl-5-hydroxy-6-metoxy-1,4-benzoquinol methylase